MSLARNVAVAAVVAVLGTGACASPPQQRSLLDARTAPMKVAPKEVSVALEVVDERPAEERVARETDTEYFVPLLIFWFAANEGNVWPESSLYSTDAVGELRSLVGRALAAAGIGARNKQSAQNVSLRIRLRHLYGVAHASSSWAFLGSGGYAKTATFGGYGYAAAELELYDSEGALIGRRAVAGSYTPSATEVASGTTTDDLTRAAVEATGDLAREIAIAVESMLVGYPGPRRVDPATTRVFFISRFTSDGQFVESAAIDIASGQIMSDEVRKRSMERYAASNEWVVDPYHGGDVRLSPLDYSRLLTRLTAAGYDARFTDNARVARFLGARVRASTPTPKSLPDGPPAAARSPAGPAAPPVPAGDGGASASTPAPPAALGAASPPRREQPGPTPTETGSGSPTSDATADANADPAP